MLKTHIGRLRAIGMIEGVSFILLLGVAMPLKYFAGMPEAVSVAPTSHPLPQSMELEEPAVPAPQSIPRVEATAAPEPIPHVTSAALTAPAPCSETGAEPEVETAAPVADPRPENWPVLLEQLGLLGMVYSIASNCELVSVQGQALEFVLDENNASLFNPGHSDKIRLALQNYFDRELSVSIDVGTPRGETPAMQQARAVRERQQAAVAEIEADQRLQALITRFDGELDRASIAPMDS